MAKKCDPSLSEKLTSLIQPKPALVESDDEDIATADKIAPAEIGSDFSADELDVPKFRKLNNQLLEEEDKKYSGKRVLRKVLDDLSDRNNSDLEKDNSEDDESVDEESEIESDSADEAEEDIEDSKKLKLDRKRPINNNFNQELFSKASEDIEKGKAIKNQLHLWDFLLDCRVKFQKCLLASNQFPNYKNFPSFENQGGPEFQLSVNKCKKSLKHLLNSLLNLQSTLLNSNEDFLSAGNTQKKPESDDEIVSSDSEEKDREQCKRNISDKKLKNTSDFSKEISKRHDNFKTYRNNTIQKWNDKTRAGNISSKNFSAFEQSTLKQIELILLDKHRLIKRTQTKRSSYHILGQEDEEPPTKKQAEQLEIFDDDDFYHQLLNELVKRKASDIMDPVQLGRHWTQLQKIRSKMKKTVDTRASKGRKVRYVVHPKLVNFMMPIGNTDCEESRMELLKSLFGRSKN